MPVNTGTVQQLTQSRNGKPQLKIDGAYYFAGRCDVSGVNQGDRIEYEWEEFGEARNGKRPKGLKNWARVNGVQPTNGANGHASAPSSALDDADRPAISNWVAHAIAAGLVKGPEDLILWAQGSQRALRALKSSAPSPRQSASNAPPDDDGMPPYEDDGPPPESPRGRW